MRNAMIVGQHIGKGCDGAISSSDGRLRRLGRWHLALIFVLFTGVSVPPAFSAKSPVAVFEEFCKFFDDHYAFFMLRGVDWEQQKKVYRPRVHNGMSKKELYSIMCEMIDPLDDPHTFVEKEDSECNAAAKPPWWTKRWDIQSFIQRKYLKPGSTRNGPVTYGMVDDTTGYINIHYMGGCFSWLFGPRPTAKEMDRALSTMKHARKIIVDLRFNTGGYDACALGFASRLTDKKRLVGSKETLYKGMFSNHRDIHFSPKGTVNTTAQVIVLTSRATVSAAEVFVMAAMTLPRVTILGEFTTGAHSDILSRKLSNGWIVGLSNESYILPDGKSYEKVGLAPHRLMPFQGDVIEQNKDDILEQALAM